MPWIEAMLRGQRVLARAHADGSLAADAGSRVEIRYKANDGRAYRASARNLLVSEGAKLHPDEACNPALSAARAAAGGRWSGTLLNLTPTGGLPYAMRRPGRGAARRRTLPFPPTRNRRTVRAASPRGR